MRSGADRVRCVMMPYRYTSGDSLEDAEACAKALGCRYDIVPIEAAVEALERDAGSRCSRGSRPT